MSNKNNQIKVTEVAGYFLTFFLLLLFQLLVSGFLAMAADGCGRGFCLIQYGIVTAWAIGLITLILGFSFMVAGVIRKDMKQVRLYAGAPFFGVMLEVVTILVSSLIYGLFSK